MRTRMTKLSMHDAANEDELRNADAIETDDMRISKEEATSNAKAGFNVKCLTDIWKAGIELIKEDDVKKSRMNEKQRFERKFELTKEIGELIKQTQSLVASTTRIPEDIPDVEQPEYMLEMMKLSKFG